MKDYHDTFKQFQQRRELISSIRSKGIDDENVLKAMLNIPRHLFMPDDIQNKAYVDKAFPIGEDQTISQPYTVAYQTELLNVKPGQKILEVGTGSAYQAAVLAEMGAEVHTIERQKKLYEKNMHFRFLSRYKNLHCHFGDGFLGWSSEAPFDRILITAAPAAIPYSLTDQLCTGGCMVLPVGTGLQPMLRITKIEDGLKEEAFDYFSFVPMLPGKNE